MLIYTEDWIILIQAKDSPNTQESLSRTIKRKHSTIRGHIQKATSELRGALSHVLNQEELHIMTTTGIAKLSLSGRRMIGIVIVKELFDDDYRKCSNPILDLAEELRYPCVLMDYAAIHKMTLYLKSEFKFINGVLSLFSDALENNVFSKPVFWGYPGESDS